MNTAAYPEPLHPYGAPPVVPPVGNPEASPASSGSGNYELIVRQGPDRARAAVGKEKERKPVDPPPVLELRVREQHDPNYTQSPYYFACCALWHATEDRPAPVAPSAALAGSTVSSLHKLKDSNGTDGAYFIFGDVSVKVEGEYRLKYHLFHIRLCQGGSQNPANNVEATHLGEAISEPFKVVAPKAFPGMGESTALSRTFAEQGVKIRIRKETRPLLKRPLPRPAEYAAQSPNGHGISAVYGTHQMDSHYQAPAVSRSYDYYLGSEYGDGYKRPRTGFDGASSYRYQQPAAGTPYQLPQGLYPQPPISNDGLLGATFPGGQQRYFYQ